MRLKKRSRSERVLACGSPKNSHVTDVHSGFWGAPAAAPPARYVYFFLLITLAVSGCAKSSNEPVDSQETVAVTQPSTVFASVDAQTTGTVKGKVFFEGEAPVPAKIPIRGNPECAVFHKEGSVLSEELLVHDGGLQNVFIYIKEGLEGQKFEPPSQSVTIGNKHCVYVPHVLGVQVNQPVVLLNEDPTLHNIHSYSKNQKNWNLGLPFQGMKQTKKFSNPEVMVTLKCDVHPWMVGYVGVLSHPYFAVSGEDGSFEIKNLPVSEYVIEAWHEKLGTQSQTVRVEPTKTTEVQFKFKP